MKHNSQLNQVDTAKSSKFFQPYKKPQLCSEDALSWEEFQYSFAHPNPHKSMTGSHQVHVSSSYLVHCAQIIMVISSTRLRVCLRVVA